MAGQSPPCTSAEIRDLLFMVQLRMPLASRYLAPATVLRVRSSSHRPHRRDAHTLLPAGMSKTHELLMVIGICGRSHICHVGEYVLAETM